MNEVAIFYPKCLDRGENSSWPVWDDVEGLIIPADLQKELVKYETASAYFLSLSKSIRKMML